MKACLMRHYRIERLMLVALLLMALWLWLPLVKWHRLFNINPSVKFTVPVWNDLSFSPSQETLPALPPEVAIHLPSVSEAQFMALQTAGYPVFVSNANTYIGPYLNVTEAQSTWQQVHQRFKIDGTITDYVMDGP